MRAVPALALALALALTGCAQPDKVRIDAPPSGGEWARCPPADALPFAVPFRAEATDETGGRAAGIYREGPQRFLWVWGSFDDSLREDRITRANAVDVARDPEGTVHVCTRADLSTPVEVDADRRSFGVALRLTSRDALPAGPVRVTVNWIAGCECDPVPRGNDSFLFEP